MLFTSTVAFASEKQTVVKEHFFYSQTRQYDYKPDKEISKDGKKYKLINVKYIVIKEKGAEAKEVEFKNLKEKKVPKVQEIEVKGEKIPYTINKEKTTYEPARKEATYVYKAENPFDFTPSNQKTLQDQMGNEFTGTLSNTAKGNDYKVSVTVPGKFVGDAEAKYFYFANTQALWDIDTKSPNWQNYETDILSYLGLPVEIYDITGGKWTSESTTNGVTTRTASFSATQRVADYVCTYSLGDGDADKFNAKAIYESPYQVKAIAEYEEIKDSHLTEILIGAVILIGACAIAAIIYFLAKKRKKREEEMKG